MPNTASERSEAVRALKRHQVSSDPPYVGDYFLHCYTFIDWLLGRYFESPASVPPVAIRLDKIGGSRMAEYWPSDGSLLPTIVLDPTKTKNARDQLEWLAHELLHHYEWVTGIATAEHLNENHHSESFIAQMMDWGISVTPGGGIHRGYVGEIWQEIVDEFERTQDIDMSQHVLPGPQEKKRSTHKFECPHCKFSFRTRRTDPFVICYHGDEPGELDGEDVGRLMEMVE